MNTIKAATTITATFKVIAIGNQVCRRQWDCEYFILTKRITCPVCGKVHIAKPYFYQEVEDKYDTPYEVGIWHEYEKTCSFDCAYSYLMQYRDILAPDAPFEPYQEQTWSDIKLEELDIKGRDNWTQDDWDSYYYIMQLRFESGYYDSQEY